MKTLEGFTLRNNQLLSLIATLSLETAECFYQHLGVPLGDFRLVSDVHRRLFIDFEYAYSGYLGLRVGQSDVAIAYTRCIKEAFGPVALSKFFVWSALTWGDLIGDVWDWFAYKTVLERWANFRRSQGRDILGAESTRAADLIGILESDYLRPLRAAGERLDGCLASDLKDWDLRILNSGNYTLSDEDTDDLESLRTPISLAISTTYFQRFWASARHAGILGILSEHRPAIERIIKQETCFPANRQLASPEEMASPAFVLPQEL
jgi:hypothetical protein